MTECKTCKWFGVQPDSRGRIVVRRNAVWPCKAPEPEQPRIPSSMTKAHGWRWPPSRSYMQGSDGADCPTYAHRDKPIAPPDPQPKEPRNG